MAGVAAKAARGQYVDNSIDDRCLPTPFSRRRHPTLNPLKRLASQTAIYGVSSVLGRFLNYLLVPLFTYTFAPAEYGVAAEFYAYMGGKPVHATLATHWARLVELLYAAERWVELATDPEITSDNFRTVPTATPTEGVGIVEAPRGTLTHHYWTDSRGVVTKGKLGNDGVFYAEEVLAKHDEEYMPPEVAATLKPHSEAAAALDAAQNASKASQVTTQ